MATFNITVTQNVNISSKPYILSETYVANDCKTEVDIFIPVPSGQTKYVQVTSTGGFSTAPFTNTINTDSVIKLAINASRNTNGSLNTEYSNVSINIRNNASSDIYYSTSITREHTTNIC